MATNPLTGTFGTTGQSAAFGPYKGKVYASLDGGATATVAVEISFDNGSTWIAIESFDASSDIVRIVDSIGDDVQYRFNCTAHTSGTVTYRMGGV